MPLWYGEFKKKKPKDLKTIYQLGKRQEKVEKRMIVPLPMEHHISSVPPLPELTDQVVIKNLRDPMAQLDHDWQDEAEDLVQWSQTLPNTL